MKDKGDVFPSKQYLLYIIDKDNTLITSYGSKKCDADWEILGQNDNSDKTGDKAFSIALHYTISTDPSVVINFCINYQASM